MGIYVAFYKGNKTGYSPSALVARFSDWLTRKLTKGPYSHCELVSPQGNGTYFCMSSSIRDGGVRSKYMDLPTDKWDLVEVPLDDAAYLKALEFFKQNKGKKYDFFGAVGVVLKFSESPSRYFCSEFVGAALGIEQPWRFSPNELYPILKSKNWS